MAIIYVNGVALPDPSEFTWGLQDISDSDSGRTEDGLMHKNRIGQKVTISLGWNNPTPDKVATILQAVNSEYISVTYPDSLTGYNETKTFYVGDRTTPMKWWNVKGKVYSKLSFNLIEV